MSASQHEVDALIARARELRSAANSCEVDLIHAEALGRQAVEAQEKISGLESVATAFAIWEIGLTFESLKAYDRAIQAYETARKFYEKSNDRVRAALASSHAARVYSLKGDHETATRLSGEAATSLYDAHTGLQGEFRALQDNLRETKTRLDALTPPPAPVEQPVKILMPRQIRAQLDKTIIGQDAAKQVLSVAVWKHLSRLNLSAEDRELVEKSDVCLVGPTGSGKTKLMAALAKIAGVPFYKADASALTEAGYVGDKPENLIYGLLRQCDFNVEMAQRAIVFLDEIDKKAGGDDFGRDVSGTGAQKALLRMLEGTRYHIAGKNAFESHYVDTSNMLFVCGGAFEGILKIVANRLQKDKAKVGFAGHVDGPTARMMVELESEDLINYGMMREFVGRLVMIATTIELTNAELASIVTDPSNALEKQIRIMLAQFGVGFDIDADAVSLIADAAIEKKTGARALRTVVETIMLPILYNLQKDQAAIRITAAMVRTRLGLTQSEAVPAA